MKRCFYRNIHILMVCPEDNFTRLAVRNICKSYCTARTLACLLVRLPAIIAVDRINCFFPWLSTADQHRLVSVFELCFQNRIQFCFKLIQCSAIIFCYTDWFIYFFAVFPDCRILIRFCKVFAFAGRQWFFIIIFYNPSLIWADYFSLHINTWKSFNAACVNSNRNFSRTTDDFLSKRIFLIANQYMADGIWIYSKRSFFFQLISTTESHSVAETFTFPESRPAKASLHTAEILFHPMI